VETGGDVLAVGMVVTKLDGDKLQPIWRYETGGDVRGRPSVTTDRLFLPTDENVVVLDMATGQREGSLDVETPVSVLALDGQIVTIGRRQMGSYSTWEVASTRMLKRVEENPTDPRPWMAMGWLAYRTQRPEPLIQSLDKAVELISEGDVNTALGRELFDQMMTMARDADRTDPNLRQQIFDRIPATISDANQEVAYRLELGAFYEAMGPPEKAVEQYQTLLEEPNHRRLLYRHAGGSRQAGLEAQRRVEALVERRGAKLYARYEAFAVKRLAELAKGGAPEPLVELAEAYPLASVTVEALAVAAERYADRGQIGEAVGLLRRAIQHTDDPAMLARLFGREAEIYEQDDQPYQAKRVLRTMMAVRPGLMPLKNGKPIQPSMWLVQLESVEGDSGVVKRINTPLRGVIAQLNGAVMRPEWRDPAAPPSPFLMLELKDRLRLHRASDMSMLWEHPIGDVDVKLLAMDRRRVWLWAEEVGRLWSLDIQTGVQQWEDSGVLDKLKAVGQTAKAGATRAPQQDPRRIIRGGMIVMRQSTLPYNSGYRSRPIVGGNERAVAVASPAGHVAVYDAVKGKPLWQGDLGMESLSEILLEGPYMVAAGMEANDQPVVVVYDLQTGVVRHRLRQPKGRETLWLGVSPLGQLIYGSGEQVVAFDLNLGQEMWVCRPGGTLTGGDSVWFGSTRMVLLTDDNDLLWLDLTDGQVASRLPLRTGFKAPLTVLQDADQWYVCGSDHIAAVNNDGRVLWRDALSAATNMIHHVLTERYVVSLSQVDSPSSETFDWRLFMLDRMDGSVRYDVTMSSERDLDRVMGIEGSLLISGDGMTAVLGGGPR
jgi:outer membrane protein assembly factor BamB